jgi:hypothetical protein
MNEEQIKQYEKLRTILENNFSGKDSFVVEPDAKSIPLVMANVAKSTRSFSVGQIIYIYDGYWGMAEKVKVVGRFRRKHNWICGVIPIKNLENFRSKIVYEPTVLKKLSGKTINDTIFTMFLDLPEWKYNREKYDEEAKSKNFMSRTLIWVKDIFGI